MMKNNYMKTKIIKKILVCFWMVFILIYCCACNGYKEKSIRNFNYRYSASWEVDNESLDYVIYKCSELSMCMVSFNEINTSKLNKDMRELSYSDKLYVCKGFLEAHDSKFGSLLSNYEIKNIADYSIKGTNNCGLMMSFEEKEEIGRMLVLVDKDGLYGFLYLSYNNDNKNLKFFENMCKTIKCR